MEHFNIGRKITVNPFEEVKYIQIVGVTLDKFEEYLGKASTSVNTRKVGNRWVILYAVEHLDFPTIIKWFAPFRGTFYFNNKTIHFSIEGNTLQCW